MARRRWLPVVAINLAAVVVAVIAFGVWQKMQPVPQAPHLEGTINAGFDQIVDDVGYIPGANYRVTARRVADGKVIYDVTYTVDANGFRIVPPHPDDPPESCVLLFGDSFTFGEGVQDDETFAADIVRQSGGKVAAVNLGESGWGPHQLLAGLQSGRFQKDVTCKPTDAVYLMIPDHVGRAVGRSPWDKHGPRFRLDAEGKPVRDGNFDSPGPPVSPNPDLDEGFLGWRRMLLGVSALGTPKEAEFTSALLIDSAREMKQAWPGIRVHLIDWNPYGNRRAAEIGARLKVAGIDVRPLDAIIPDYLDHIDRYLIAPKIEAHPNVTGHKRIAAYILHEIVAKGP